MRVSKPDWTKVFLWVVGVAGCMLIWCATTLAIFETIRYIAQHI